MSKPMQIRTYQKRQPTNETDDISSSRNNTKKNSDREFWMKKKPHVVDQTRREGQGGEPKPIRKFSRIVRLPSGDSMVKEVASVKG